jgi:chromosome segregation ATPase
MSNSEIAGILVKLKVDNSRYQSQLKQTENKTKQSAKQMTKAFDRVKLALRTLFPVLAGLAITSKVISGFQELRQEVDKIQKIGLKLGETTENLSRLKFIAEQSGIGFETLTQSLTDMSRKITEAKMNTGDAVLALQKLGLSADELQEKSPYEQFMTIAKAIPLIENASEKIYILDKLFGGAGTTLQQAFSGGYEAIERLANSTPNVISQETADRVAEFNDNMHRLAENLQSLVLPVLSKVAETVNDIFSIFKEKSEIEQAQNSIDAYTNSIKSAKNEIKELEKKLTYFSVFEMKNITREPIKQEIEAQQRIIEMAEKQREQLKQKLDLLTKQKKKLEEIEDSEETATVNMIDPFKQKLDQLKATITLLKKEGTQGTIKEIKELENVLKELESNVFSTSEKITQYMIDSTDTWSDNLTDAILSGKDSFKSLGEFAKNILDDIGRQLIKYNITQPLVKAGVSYFSDDFVGQVKQGINKGANILTNMTGNNNTMTPSLRIEQNITITSGAEVSEIDKKISQQVPGIVEAAKAGVIEATRNNPVFRR